MNRDEIVSNIETILMDSKDVLGFKTFVHYPTSAAREEDTPCLFLYEGVDQVTNKSFKSRRNTPKIRALEIFLEVLDKPEDIMARIRALREKILSFGDTFLQSSISEDKTEGPMACGIPNIVVCRLVLSAIYKDTIQS